MKLKQLKKYTTKKIAILGFGKEGKSSLDFLLKLGMQNITILDKNEFIEKKTGIKYILGKDYLQNLGSYDLIFKSPGISPYNPQIIQYIEKLTSQAQIFFDNYEGKVIGITGTKGKSTTSTLTYKTLQKIGYKTKIVGNIGTPVLEEIDIINSKPYDFIIYELSSYMLEGLNLNLFIGVVNNIYDCHLDWHSGRDNYQKAKLGIINNSENALVNFELKKETKNIKEILYFGEDGDFYFRKGLFYKKEHVILKDEEIVLEGEHNRKNITVVLGVLDIISTKNLIQNIVVFQSVLSTFIGLPHRLENLGLYNGITFIDDAIATTPESTIAAIKTYEHNIGTILLGGQDSGFNFKQLKDILGDYNIGNIVLFPDTGEKIFGNLSNHEYETVFTLKGKYSPRILKTKSMKSAVDFAFKNTEQGKICILSNAAPSFSLWGGYIQKGLEFQKEVKHYPYK